MTGTDIPSTVATTGTNLNTVNAQSSSTNNTTIASNQIHIAKFVLPEFTNNDPEAWFAAVEHILLANKVTNDTDRFSHVLQAIPATMLTHMKDIINSTTQDKYEQAKLHLLQFYGQSEEERISRLLSGVDITLSTKLSIIWAKMKSIVGNKSNVVKSMWHQKLPQRMREMLAYNVKLAIQDQVNMADSLYEVYQTTENQLQVSEINNDPTVKPVTAATAATTSTANSSNNDNMLQTILTLVQGLQAQISAVQSKQAHLEHGSYLRGRSRERHENRNRNYRSPSPFGRNKTITNGLCSYHSKFGDSAYRCAPGC